MGTALMNMVNRRTRRGRIFGHHNNWPVRLAKLDWMRQIKSDTVERIVEQKN